MRINKSLIAYVPSTGAGSGSVTSVGLSATMPTGLSAAISGSPITTSGTIGLTLSYAAGYAIPTTVKQSNWDDAYTFVAAFPTQTGNSGKYLTTNGSALSWATIAGSSITGAALTETDDTNVTMTLGGTPATALLRAVSMTLGWAGQLSVARGGTGANSLQGVLIGNLTAPVTAITGIGGQLLRANPSTGVYEFFTPAYMSNPMTTLGDIIYGNAAGAPIRLGANTTANNMYLRSVSSGTPSWASIQGGDIVGAAMTSTNDTNIQITLGGTPNNSLLRAVSLTMGWTGQLAVGRGGTGASTLTGVAIGNGTSAMTAVAGTANQFLRRNSANTAYEFFTPSFLTGSGAVQYVPKWTDTTVLGNSQIIDDGTNVGIGIAPLYKLDVNGSIGMSTLPLIARVGNYTVYYDSGSANALALGNSTVAANLYSNTTHAFRNRGGTVTYLAIDSIGISVSGSIYMTGSVLTGSWQASVIAPTYGGTGASTITGVVIGSGISTMVGVAGTAGQLLRRNALNTAYEFFTPTYMNNVFTTGGDLVVSNSAGAPLRLAGNTTTTRKYLSQIGDGTFVTSTTWETVSGGGGITGSGTANRIPKWATSTSLTDSLIVDSGTTVTVYGLLEYATSQAGSGVALMYSTNTDTTAGIAHQSRFGTQNLGSGIGRTLLYAASNTTGVTRGELAVLSENGGGLLMNIGTTYTASNYALSLFNIAGTEVVRLNTSGNSFLNGGDVLFGSSGFYYDATNKRLGIGVAAPSQALDVSANFGIAKITSAVGTNASFFQFTNTGGNFFIGQEGSTGITFGATAYASVIYVPTNRNLEIFQGSFRAVQLLDTGQWKFNDYTSTTSFPGTAAGYLAFTSSGDIITVAAPGAGAASPYRIDFNSTMPDTWTNMPSAISFYDGSNAFITAAELTNFTQVRLLINKLGTAGAAGSIIILRYNTSYTQNANLWSTIGTTSVQLAVNNTNQFLETAWIDLVAGAKADVFIALMGSGGDGAADPIFGMITAEFR